MAGLCFLTFNSQAQTSWGFQYGFQNIFATNALNYVVEQNNIERTTEAGSGFTYWNPINNGTPATLTMKFTFPQPTAEIFLNAVLTSYNFSSGEYGSGSLSGSIDGTNWLLLLNAPTPASISGGYDYFTNLPSALLGTKQIWIQAQLQTTGNNIMAQYLRQQTGTNDIFDLDVNYAPSSSTNSGNEPFITNGLVAYYPFNGNANDASGNGNNGTVNNITFVADRFGNTNAAASFAGNSTSYIQINTTNLNLTSNFTISVWINYIGGAGIENPRVFSTAGYEIVTQDAASSDRQMGFDNTTLTAGAPTVNSPNGVPANVWTHIVGVRCGTNLLLYVNASLVGTLSTTEPPDYSRGFIPAVGVNSGALAQDNYAGLIDDLGIYNRALSALEIAEIYQSSLLAGIVAVPGIIVAGNSNQTYSIQYVNNLSSTNWTTLVSNIVLEGNSYLYPDTNAVGQQQRFYRVVAP